MAEFQFQSLVGVRDRKWHFTFHTHARLTVTFCYACSQFEFEPPTKQLKIEILNTNRIAWRNGFPRRFKIIHITPRKTIFVEWFDYLRLFYCLIKLNNGVKLSLMNCLFIVRRVVCWILNAWKVVWRTEANDSNRRASPLSVTVLGRQDRAGNWQLCCKCGQ